MEEVENKNILGNKKIVLYTIHCRHCEDLQKKLDDNNIEYETCEDVEKMIEKNFKTAPMLEVDGEIYNFTQAMKLINEGL